MECKIEELKSPVTNKFVPNAVVAFQYERIIRDLREELDKCLSGEIILTPEEVASLEKELNEAIDMYNRFL